MTASPPDESAEGRGAGAAPPFPPLAVDVFTGPESAFFATSSLIMGERTAILVDAQLTRSAGRELAEWIAGKGRQLLAIVVTHQHPDHYFGADEVLRLFPDAQLLAAPSVVEGIRQTAAAKVAQWKPVYGDDIPDRPRLPAPLLPQPLMIDGQLIRVLPLGQADSAGSTVVYLPSIHTVVAGDFVYNGTHVWTADTDPAARGQWSHNLGRIADLSVDRVIAGHRAPGMDDAAHRVLGFTAEYLRDFDEALADHPRDAEALATAVNERYGGLTLPAILELGAAANVGRAEVPQEDNGIIDAEIVDEQEDEQDDGPGDER
ncbi:MBL fold metallo-hydrolase [Kitasatospora griseola]|uniref:MBL fold metallo-hydrolase n=1 Tax=Kitasatospora griseola TaxID=2064 RepID=UPI0016716143|nr:MBL fold metallo-hydrolase [Kitasatospora griseola]GGQ70912.1 MBL fold metallo-hydrolase [Kitasatospora griseola]